MLAGQAEGGRHRPHHGMFICRSRGPVLIAAVQFKFPSAIVQHQYFNGSSVSSFVSTDRKVTHILQTLLVRLADHTIWQSSSEGYNWIQITHSKKFVMFYMHKYASDRAYLITPDTKSWYTTQTGTNWHQMNTPTRPNSLGITHLHFHPTKEEYIIWIGEEGCDSLGASCAAVAYYSPNNGRDWERIDNYVRNCEWARDKELKVDNTQIICERYAIKRGDQRLFGRENPLELVSGTQYFKNQKKLFGHVVGFTKFSEYLVVAEVITSRKSLVCTRSDRRAGQTRGHAVVAGICRRSNVCDRDVPAQPEAGDSRASSDLSTCIRSETRCSPTLSSSLPQTLFSCT